MQPILVLFMTITIFFETRFKVNLMYQVELSTDWSMRINYIRFKKSKRHRSCFYSNSISRTSRRRHYAILKAHDLWRLCFLTFFLFSSILFLQYRLRVYMSWRIILVIDILDTTESFMIVKYAKKKLSSDKSLIFFEHFMKNIFTWKMDKYVK